jgi:hypothetical protein
MSSLVRVSLGIPTYGRGSDLVDAIRGGLSRDFPLADLLAALPAARPMCLR